MVHGILKYWEIGKIGHWHKSLKSLEPFITTRSEDYACVLKRE